MESLINTAQNIGTVVAVILMSIFFCKQYIDKYKKDYSTAIPKGVIKQNGIDVEIEQKMNYYKELLKADRVLLFEFHNGQHYSSYRSALKMSPSYEVFRAGLESIRNECSNLPIAIMPNYLAEIISTGYSYCPNIENIHTNMQSTYSFKKALGINAYYDRAIKDVDGNIIGFVAVEWNHAIPEHVHLLEDYGDELDHLAWYLEESIKRLVEIDRSIKKRK